ncbi:hypothetical protein [Thermococcus sp.]|uniref:hypothetical protein n=1 Tax=Thermococcus sp. TaxID=35749 RepID=UPI00261EC6A1|nr:hypothetical protein [Thermococcus sp.]
MKTAGVFLVLIGITMLPLQFRPAFLEPLRIYAPYIRGAFWGVMFIAGGLYFLARGFWRRLVLFLYLLYLVLYLVV